MTVRFGTTAPYLYKKPLSQGDIFTSSNLRETGGPPVLLHITLLHSTVLQNQMGQPRVVLYRCNSNTKQSPSIHHNHPNFWTNDAILISFKIYIASNLTNYVTNFSPFNIKKSPIPETPTLSTNADRRTNTNLKKLRDFFILFFIYFFDRLLDDFLYR